MESNVGPEWYFAIGSMMHPYILGKRDLKPTESLPGELLDYKLAFVWSVGMGMAIPEDGASFHGVLHKCTQEELTVLDSIESSYLRTPAKAKLYDGTIVDCKVYSQTADFFNNPE
jgi:hypothetical protein